MAKATAKPFDNVLIVMFENQYRSYVMQDPYMNKLARAGADLTNSFGAFHPSQTNYLASLAGEVCAVTNDNSPAKPLMQRTLVDVLEEAEVTWKAYMEGLPVDPWNEAWKNPDYNKMKTGKPPIEKYPNDGSSLARYFRKHNAFASFHSIQASESRWKNIVGEKEFWHDVFNENLPQYGWFTPDIWNDGHYLFNTHQDTNPRTQLVPQVSSWLEYVFLGNISKFKVEHALGDENKHWGLNLDVDLLLTNPSLAWEKCNLPPRTMLVITFDEADFDAVGYDTSYDGPNQIYTVLLGEMISPGTVIDMPVNHYGLMKTIQRNFQTNDLGKNDRDSSWLRFMWGQEFLWDSEQSTELESSGEIAVTSTGNGACLIFRDRFGELCCSEFDGEAWSSGRGTGVMDAADFTLAGFHEYVVLFYTDDAGQLCRVEKREREWTDPTPLDHFAAGKIAASAYIDQADDQEKLMICWQSESQFIKYSIFDENWAEQSGEVGQLTDGPMELTQLGASLFLVYKERNRQNMRMTSFNLAPYNAFSAKTFKEKPDPNNDTSLHQWSPFDVHVGHFSRKLSSLQDNFRFSGQLAMATIEGETHLVYRAPYADTPQAIDTVFGLTGVFTASSAASNGWGTIDQTGWTSEKPIPNVRLGHGSGIAMTRSGENLLLVWQPVGTNSLQYCMGGYRNTNK